MDVETINSNEVKPMKRSFMRKWGPAIVAIVGAIAVNVALLGPTGHKLPSLSEKQLYARKLGENVPRLYSRWNQMHPLIVEWDVVSVVVTCQSKREE